MDKKSKLISGLTGTEVVKKLNNCFTDAEKHLIIQEYLETGCTKVAIWQKYTGQQKEHGSLLRWMRKLGYANSIPKRRRNFVSNFIQMKNKKTELSSTESFENLQLKKRIEELESQLKDAEMKAIAFSTMIDIAEKEFSIPIRKKYNTKPSKK